MDRHLTSASVRSRTKEAGRIVRLGLILVWVALGLGVSMETGGAEAVKSFPGSRESSEGHQAGLANPYAHLYQSILDQAVKSGLVGLAAYIKTPEEGVWIGTGGYADLETHTPIQPESVFYSASHLKILTATAVMMLWDAGLIDLEATIDRYLPAWISSRLANADRATVKNLLNHTSGIPNYELTSPWGNNPLDSTWQDDIESILDKKAEFAPGSQYSYCNTEFVLLAVIIDQVTGDHGDFLSGRIFLPLGMIHTYYRKEAGLPRPPFLITPYLDRYNDGLLESAGAVFPTIRLNHAYGAGGLLADLADYARFSEALFGGELVSPAALQMMSTPEGAAKPYGYGLGMIIRATEGVDAAKFGLRYGHGGRGYFGSMEMNVYRQAGITIGYASNYGYPGFMTPVQEVFDTLERQFADAVFNGRASGSPERFRRSGPATPSVPQVSIRKGSR
jgi:D-alanyl-D-alanine carboxypeptidase